MDCDSRVSCLFQVGELPTRSGVEVVNKECKWNLSPLLYHGQSLYSLHIAEVGQSVECHVLCLQDFVKRLSRYSWMLEGTGGAFICRLLHYEGCTCHLDGHRNPILLVVFSPSLYMHGFERLSGFGVGSGDSPQ